MWDFSLVSVHVCQKPMLTSGICGSGSSMASNWITVGFAYGSIFRFSCPAWPLPEPFLSHSFWPKLYATGDPGWFCVWSLHMPCNYRHTHFTGPMHSATVILFLQFGHSSTKWFMPACVCEKSIQSSSSIRGSNWGLSLSMGIPRNQASACTNYSHLHSVK